MIVKRFFEALFGLFQPKLVDVEKEVQDSDLMIDVADEFDLDDEDKALYITVCMRGVFRIQPSEETQQKLERLPEDHIVYRASAEYLMRFIRSSKMIEA